MNLGIAGAELFKGPAGWPANPVFFQDLTPILLLGGRESGDIGQIGKEYGKR